LFGVNVKENSENKMAKYLQTNEHGYVTGVTDKPSPSRGIREDFKKVGNTEAGVIVKMLDALHSQGDLLHLDDLVEIVPEVLR
jgi:hypothetical protein